MTAHRSMTLWRFIVGPAPCRDCGLLVTAWQHPDGRFVWRERDGQRHYCAVARAA